jgi:beta-lactamase class A
MITISDNYSAYLLVTKLRLSNVTKFMQEQGLKNSKTGTPPHTTASDIALFYERLYGGSVVDSESSRQMLEVLARQQLNDRIPKYLPKGTEIAHKTGEIEGFKHDAGIIFGKDPILFVVLSDSSSPLGAAERIALISKDVFNYFEER